MKISDERNPQSQRRVNVWLEVGRDGRCFSYSSDPALELSPGDLVRVRLRGRPVHGLVVEQESGSESETDFDQICTSFARLEWSKSIKSSSFRVTKVIQKC